jgi:hypothetical protein
MKNQTPTEIITPILDEAEKVVFPHEAKTLGGKLLRFGFKVLKFFVLKKAR